MSNWILSSAAELREHVCSREGRSLWERAYNLFFIQYPLLLSRSKVHLRPASEKNALQPVSYRALWSGSPSVSPGGVVPFFTKCLNLRGQYNGDKVMQWPSGDTSHLAGGTLELQLLLKQIFKSFAQNGAASEGDSESPASPTECIIARWLRCSPAM